MKKYLLLFLCFLGLNLGLFAQAEIELARQYYNNGEYEKAAALYEKLYEQYPTSEYFYSSYYKTLVQLNAYDDAEKLIKKQMKKLPKNASLYVDMGALLEAKSEKNKADEQYRKAIDLLPAEQPEIVKLATAFSQSGKQDLAIQAYEKGNVLLKNKTYFSFELAGLYSQKGDVKKMIESYLNSLEAIPERLVNVQAMLQRSLSEDDMNELLSQLLTRAQEQPDLTVYPEMLAWVYVQQKDFKNAFRQITAIDKRFQENGGRVYKLALTAISEQDYEGAIDGLNYIVDKKGSSSPYYVDAKRNILNCKRRLIVEDYEYNETQLRDLEREYEGFLTEFGRDKTTSSIMTELAQLEAFYLNDLTKAIAILNEVVAMPFNERNANDKEQLSQVKLELGDYYLMSGEIWEATLLYSQVDKALKDAPLGEDARYRNARLSYFQGDFEWAQGQLDALKASTSELISNDAIDLSVFITEHYGLDTTPLPMEMFAMAELYSFQNKFTESFNLMDSIMILFPGHLLLDDILFEKAEVYIKKRDYSQAISLLEKILTEHADGILVDNALFKMANLYEGPLADPEKAKGLYEKIILEHNSSIFISEARKRFRVLRGDKIDGVQ
jgi:tetratricopeptide (TPR) repeat protein